MKDFFSKIPRFLKGIYFIWLTIHFYLVMSTNEVTSNIYGRGLVNKSREYFYPFYDIKYYDYTEFLFYAIIPIFMALIIYYLKPQKDKDTK